MLNKKEIISILIVTIILSFSINLLTNLNVYLATFLIVFLILIINITTKKITGFFLDSHVEVKIWEIERYGFRNRDYFKKPIYAGLFIPVLISVLSLGYIKWMAVMTFDVKPRIYRAAKRHGLYNFSDMSEYHLGLIAISGVLISLISAGIGYLINFPEFAKLSIYFAFFNMIPFSDLDGNKIFFGSLVWWIFLAALVSIGLFWSITVI